MTRFTLIILALLSSYILSAQQQVNAKLINNSNETKTTLANLSDITFGVATHQNVLLKELASDEAGYAEFEINYLDNSDVTFTFEEQDAGGTTYSIHLANGVFDIPNTSINNQSYSSGDKFKIQRCDSEITILKNEVIQHTFSSANMSQKVFANLIVTQADLVSGNEPNVLFSFPNSMTNCSGGGGSNFTSGIYTQLKRKLDGGYTVVTAAKPSLRFTYEEDYAIVTNENDNLDFKILNWQNQILDSGTLSNNYGVNWQSLSLASANLTNGFYTLEVEDINKDEKYYLRFQFVE